MPGFDLRAEFAKLCADQPAGDADEVAFEETLGLAVQRVLLRTQGQRLGSPTVPPLEGDQPAMNCPFMVSVMALSFQSLAASF
jgi:hypothetical protein